MTKDLIINGVFYAKYEIQDKEICAGIISAIEGAEFKGMGYLNLKAEKL